MAPLGLRDREAGTVTLTTSLGLWKKLDRVRRNPGVAVAYHAREHGVSDRPGFVLVQGRASFSAKPDRAWLESITPNWDRFLVPRSGGVLGRLLDVHYSPHTKAGYRLPRSKLLYNLGCASIARGMRGARRAGLVG